MRRIVFGIVAALAAVAVWYGLRLAQRTSNAAVTVFLPRETILFAHLPDFNRTRDQWHQSDIYQLYLEPSVQSCFRKPLGHVSGNNAFTQRLQELKQLDAKDIFVALTSLNNDKPTFLAGFRFRGSQNEAEKFVEKWRALVLQKTPGFKHEIVNHQQHKIDLFTGASSSWATAYDSHWFFAANDLSQLKSLLDRADGRLQEALDRDETFRSALSQAPPEYAAGIYLQPKVFVEKLAELRANH